MTGYILKRIDDGKYVADLLKGGTQSYTTRLERVKIFATPGQAQGEACGNERVLSLAAVLRELI